MISNCIIVHGIPPDKISAENPKTRSYDKHWIPWIKENLEKKAIVIKTPLMPEPWRPSYKIWKKEFDKLNIDNKTILIGHSGSCAFLVRWLGETGKKIKKLILVAPWTMPSQEFSEEENELYDFKINKKINENVEDIIIFTSNDEENDGKKSAKIYSNALKTKLITLKNHGHYCEEDMGTVKFPELLEAILE